MKAENKHMIIFAKRKSTKVCDSTLWCLGVKQWKLLNIVCQNQPLFQIQHYVSESVFFNSGLTAASAVIRKATLPLNSIVTKLEFSGTFR